MPDLDRYSAAAEAAKSEIRDRIHLYCHAWDRQRWELFSEVFHERATCTLSSIAGPWREWVEQGKQVCKGFDDTHHQVGNTLIRLDGDVASAETYVTAYHRVRADAPPGGLGGGTGEAYDLIVGARYIDRFERIDGRWKIANRRTASDWRHVQVRRDANLDKVPANFRGGHGDQDPSLPVTKNW